MEYIKYAGRGSTIRKYYYNYFYISKLSDRYVRKAINLS